MKPSWQSENELGLAELRAQIRDKDIKVMCAAIGCENVAVDVHHLDGEHSNDSPQNLAPACKLCHNAEHGITAEMSDLKLLTRLFYEAQEKRKAAANRVRAYEGLGIEVPYAHAALEDAKQYEKHLKKHVRALLRVNLFYNAWLKHVKGIGPLLAASLLAELGSPQRFNTVSALWSYSGLKVKNGEAVRRTKGEKSNWNGAVKTTAWKIGSQFVKTPNCLGRQLYEQYKAYYIERDGATPKWKPHRRAKRRVAKDFLRCMWVAWRESMGLDVTEPKAGTWPMAEDWIERGGLALHIRETPTATLQPAPLEMEARQPTPAMESLAKFGTGPLGLIHSNG